MALRGFDSRVGPFLDTVRFALRQERVRAIQLGLVNLEKRGSLEEEEVEWAKMFTEGIFYSNIFLPKDRSPTISCHYVAAYCTQSMLRHKIVGHSLS